MAENIANRFIYPTILEINIIELRNSFLLVGGMRAINKRNREVLPYLPQFR